MNDHKVAVRRLLVTWFDGEISSLLRGRKSSQFITGKIPKRNVGEMVQEIIDTSPFEFRIVPIAVSYVMDLRSTALRQLVVYLPWDELQRKMTLDKLTSAGVSVNAELVSLVAHLVKTSATVSAEVRSQKLDEYIANKSIKLESQMQIVDVVNLFFEWSKKAKIEQPWDAVVFYLQVKEFSIQEARLVFGPFLDDIALDINRRVFALLLPDTRIDFGMISTAVGVMEFQLPSDLPALARELLRLAKDRVESLGKISKMIGLSHYRELRSLVEDSESFEKVLDLLIKNDFDLPSWEG